MTSILQQSINVGEMKEQLEKAKDWVGGAINNNKTNTTKPQTKKLRSSNIQSTKYLMQTIKRVKNAALGSAETQRVKVLASSPMT